MSGVSGSFALPALTRGLSSSNAHERAVAAAAIARFGARARPAVPALVAALDTDDRACLGTLGKALAVLEPSALLAAVEHPRAEIRRGAIRAIGGLGPIGRVAAPALRRALADPDEQVQLAAREALEQIGAD
jgi:HEAT repeat protein